ncbi:MAG: hypothetical protein U5L96_03495 [Owenweeksia sp.]|nr:hypothetical protein [Owenweeksia sp.]
MAGLFFKSESVTKARQYSRIAVLIPGFKEDAIIVNTALKSLEQSYPRDYYQVLLIADGYQPKTLHNLAQIDVNVLEVAFETSTKGRAINAGLEYLSADPPEPGRGVGLGITLWPQIF